MIPKLEQGDCLLYKPSSLFGVIIAVKTWTWTSHTEVYAGDDMTFASRWEGVNQYSFDPESLGYVLRPKGPLNFQASKDWFYRSARGQKYDWLGLLCFTLAVKQGAPDRMFCSEFATRFYRAGGFGPFAAWEDADHIAPAQFLQSTEFDMIWRS